MTADRHVATCETNGHLWNALGKCVMCGTPKTRDPPTLDSCPFCQSFNVKLFKADEKEYAQCMDCTACGPDHVNGRHWNTLVPRRPASGCYCPPDKCMAPIIMGRQMPCLRRALDVTSTQSTGETNDT